jgi:hypothetical protein
MITCFLISLAIFAHLQLALSATHGTLHNVLGDWQYRRDAPLENSFVFSIVLSRQNFDNLEPL